MKIIGTKNLLIIATTLLSFTSCGSGSDPGYSEKKLELGVVQKEIREGMSQDQVAIALGSPNIVTHDKNKKEAWIYDKIATEVRHTGASGFILFCPTALILPMGGSVRTSKTERSQKTLTVVIKFDAENLVESVSFHSSKF